MENAHGHVLIQTTALTRGSHHQGSPASFCQIENSGTQTRRKYDAKFQLICCRIESKRSKVFIYIHSQLSNSSLCWHKQITYNKQRHKLMPHNLISDALICLKDSSNVRVQHKTILLVWVQQIQSLVLLSTAC